MLTILDAIQDRSLFGASPVFANLEPWKPWLIFLSAVYGLPLDAEGVALFLRCTGRSSYNPTHGGTGYGRRHPGGTNVRGHTPLPRDGATGPGIQR